jgi:hypothetical protein
VSLQIKVDTNFSFETKMISRGLIIYQNDVKKIGNRAIVKNKMMDKWMNT